MAGHHRLTEQDIVVGTALPWSVYDASGLLLLKKGVVIVSPRQLKILLDRGLYREPTKQDVSEKTPFADSCSPFELIYDYANRLTQILDNIEVGKQDLSHRITKLCQELSGQCDHNADAMLGAVHLCFDYPYSIIHSIHIAILCELVMRRMKIDVDRRLTVMAAALTSNVAMRRLQDRLQKHQGSLNSEQQQQIELHPEQGVELLQRSGINDSLWLQIVLQHHERLDGSGYPKGLKGDQILQESMLVAIADRYTAMIVGRSYRDGVHAKEALRKMFVDRGVEFDEGLLLTLIKELGIYPPGAFVKLQNGETAVVIKRGKDSKCPTVMAIQSPRGGPYSRPLRRDCSMEQLYSIVEICDFCKSHPISLPLLWGFQ